MSWEETLKLKNDIQEMFKENKAYIDKKINEVNLHTTLSINEQTSFIETLLYSQILGLKLTNDSMSWLVNSCQTLGMVLCKVYKIESDHILKCHTMQDVLNSKKALVDLYSTSKANSFLDCEVIMRLLFKHPQALDAVFGIDNTTKLLSNNDYAIKYMKQNKWTRRIYDVDTVTVYNGKAYLLTANNKSFSYYSFRVQFGKKIGSYGDDSMRLYYNYEKNFMPCYPLTAKLSEKNGYNECTFFPLPSK